MFFEDDDRAEAQSAPPDQKAQDIEYHRHAAAIYDAQVTRHFHFFHVYSLHPWIEKLVTARPGAHVLDMGTGTGVVACTLAGYGCKVAAVDHSLDMLAKAQARAAILGYDGIQFDLGDCESLPYADNTFDAVTIQGVLHHLSDIRPSLQEAVRVLKTGGSIYISEPVSEGACIGRLFQRLAVPARWVKRKLRPSSPPSVSDHEAPLVGANLLETLQYLGISAKPEYLIQFGAVRFLPQFLRIWVTLFFSWPTRRSGGDIIFVTGRKTALVRQKSRVPSAPATAAPAISATASSPASLDAPASIGQNLTAQLSEASASAPVEPAGGEKNRRQKVTQST
jgi:ubiquinone/menaquinone biosynthesis C-methylase UbiE